MSNGDDRQLDELTKFGVLIIVMVGVVLVVAISRPLIFGHIVPVVMGEGLELPSLRADLEPPVLRVPAVEESTEPAGVEEAAPDSETPAEPAEESLSEDISEEAAASVTHVVRSGETLTVIARQYNVTLQDIVQANGITSPDRIRAGDELVIPQP